RMQFEPGYTILSTVSRPIPGPLWPGKPGASDDVMNAELFPEQVARTRAAPAYSILGGFYFDAWIPGVVVGMLLVGVLFRALYEHLLMNANNAWMQAIYAAMLPYSIVLMRGNVPDTLSR